MSSSDESKSLARLERLMRTLIHTNMNGATAQSYDHVQISEVTSGNPAILPSSTVHRIVVTSDPNTSPIVEIDGNIVTLPTTVPTITFEATNLLSSDIRISTNQGRVVIITTS